MNAIVPKVTVLMPVYNGERFLRQAIDSVLGQSFEDFELLVIDDGSTDASATLVEGYADPRVRLVRNQQNMKLIATLNRGLDLARGEFVARLDADDISLPSRLERQVAYLEAHPEVGLCGTWAKTIGEQPGVLIDPPIDYETIRCRLLYSNAFVHSSVMLRKAAFEAHGLRYDARYLHAEDFQLWQKASELFPVANLDEVLVHYRVDAESICHKHHEPQMETLRQIDRDAVSRLGIDVTTEELLLHRCLDNWLIELTPSNLEKIEDWLMRLDTANGSVGIYPQKAFRLSLRRLWFTACHRAAANGRWMVRRYLLSPLSANLPMDLRQVFIVTARWALFYGRRWRKYLSRLKKWLLGQGRQCRE